MHHGKNQYRLILDVQCFLWPVYYLYHAHKGCNCLYISNGHGLFCCTIRESFSPGKLNAVSHCNSLLASVLTFFFLHAEYKAKLASFPGSCVGEEERQPGTHCLRMCQVPLVTCILLCYTKITVNFCLPAVSHTAWLYSLWDTYGRF